MDVAEEKYSGERLLIDVKEILSDVNTRHAIVILCEISAADIRSILEFVYKGEVSISAERLSSVLKAAETLKISGLMGVSGGNLPLSQEDSEEVKLENEEVQTEEPKDSELDKDEFVDSEEGAISLEDNLKLISAQTDPDNYDNRFIVLANESEDTSDLNLEIITSDENKRRKREFSKKLYSEDSLSAALEDLANGSSLVEASNTHRIPRSTLYARARNFGIMPAIARNEYSEEKLAAAVETVKAGASLQSASQMYGVPKTVLWRRVQKDVGYYALSRRSRRRQRYLPHIREAAIRALENGEKINKVSSTYKIPKTTLFREKSRLVEAGKLPASCLNKRPPNNDRFKQVRLTQAVAACKEGLMSQAKASDVFKVSKTTIWRRLHQMGGNKQIKLLEPKIEPEDTDLNFEEVTEIPVTYLNAEESYPFIILTPNNSLNTDVTYQVAEDVVIENVLVPENLENVGEVIEIQETPSYTEEVVFQQESDEGPT